MSLATAVDAYQYPAWKLPVEMLPHNRAMTFICCLGLLSNSVLLLHLYRNRSLINVSSASLVQIAVCYFIVCVSSIFFTIAHDVAQNYELPWIYCQVNGFIYIMSFAISALSFVVIACERYLLIIHSKKISVKQLCGMWALAWSSSIIQAVMPLATATYFVPQDSHWYCLGNFQGSTPSHRAYSIFSLFSAVAACGIIAFAYYSIYKKVIAERFKWKDMGFTLKTATPSAFDSKATNQLNFKSSSTSGGTEASPSPNVSTSANKSSVHTHGEHANLQQVRLTIRLAFYTFYFLAMWTGTILSWTYQTITLNKVSSYLEYGITMVPFLVCVMHPILVLIIDPRWKIQLPHLLEYFVSRKTNSS